MSRDPASAVLYDTPGPHTRRRTMIASIVASVALLVAAYVWIYLPLERNGQFTMRKWGPIIDPDNPVFPQLWRRLGEGLQNTLIAAVLAIIGSLLLGTALAVLRVELQALRRRRYAGVPPAAAYALRALTWVLNLITRVFVEVFRGLPVVITMYFVGRALPEFGVDMPTLWYVVIGLTLYNGVVIAEILRSGMTGLPGGQAEAAAAIGFSPLQTTRLILLPQAYRIMLPALISQTVVVLKDTSLGGFLVGFQDLLQVANQAIQVLFNPIQLYFVVGVIYIVINYSLSKLAEYTQRRLSQARRVGAPPTAAPGTELEREVVAGTTT